MDLPHHLELDLWARYTGSITGFGTTNTRLILFEVPAYLTLDARLAWKPQDDFAA